MFRQLTDSLTAFHEVIAEVEIILNNWDATFDVCLAGSANRPIPSSVSSTLWALSYRYDEMPTPPR